MSMHFHMGLPKLSDEVEFSGPSKLRMGGALRLAYFTIYPTPITNSSFLPPSCAAIRVMIFEIRRNVKRVKKRMATFLLGCF